mgnify:CR=1 FL=1
MTNEKALINHQNFNQIYYSNIALYLHNLHTNLKVVNDINMYLVPGQVAENNGDKI